MKKTFLKFLYLFFAIIFSFSYGVAEDKAEVEKTTLAKINTKIMAVLFFDVAGGSIKVPDVDYSGKQALNDDGSPKLKTVSIPFLIFILATGAVFFSFWYGFINIRGFKHSIDVIRGKYDREEDHGEISHFRALTSALSATVGLGNIAGVAIAIQIGGPGAVIWMVFTAIFGMSSKFSSCTLSQMYRQINSDGTISGGPMYYLDIGLRQMGKPMRIIGKILGVMYALMVMGGSVGGNVWITESIPANSRVYHKAETILVGSEKGK